MPTSTRICELIMVLLPVLSFSLFVILQNVSAYPDGAPGESCVRHKPNHGGQPQPLETLPFLVEASESSYKPGDSIAVRIKGKNGVYFKGFFVQAVDREGRWIGTFEPTPFSVSHPECSATTHAENHEKEEATLIWHPAKDSNGTVRFLASVVINYKMYWVDAPASAPAAKKDDTESKKVFHV